MSVIIPILSMIGLWDSYHIAPRSYGNPLTYEVASKWLRGYGLVEDWGCGTCWSRHKNLYDEYRGVDGSGEFANIREDLVKYHSNVPCILMRHVLEHNERWLIVLTNALSSFQKRMALILFMPLKPSEELLYREADIPYIFLPRDKVMAMISPYLKRTEVVGDETCFLLEK